MICAALAHAHTGGTDERPATTGLTLNLPRVRFSTTAWRCTPCALRLLYEGPVLPTELHHPPRNTP